MCRYMVDSADHEKLDASKNELHSLIDKPQLAGIPVSICVCMWNPYIVDPKHTDTNDNI